MKRYVLFAVGADRPGIVASVAAAIERAGGNMEDSKMTRLAGDFALMAAFVASSDAAENIASAVGALAGEGVWVQVRPGTDQQAVLRGNRPVVRFAVSGHDRPGIVRRIGEACAAQGGNVVTMETKLDHQAFTGTPLFTVHAEVQVADPACVEALRRALEEACADLAMVVDVFE